MRDAVMLLDQVTSALPAEEPTLENFCELFGDGDYALPLVAAMARGDYPAMYAALEDALAQAGEPAAVTARLVDCLADLLVLRSGGSHGAGSARWRPAGSWRPGWTCRG